jgi:hypothetical protein
VCECLKRCLLQGGKGGENERMKETRKRPWWWWWGGGGDGDGGGVWAWRWWWKMVIMMVGGNARGTRKKSREREEVWYARHASADVCRKHHELVYDFHALNPRVNISSDAPELVFERPFATERKNLQCDGVCVCVCGGGGVNSGECKECRGTHVRDSGHKKRLRIQSCAV